MSGNRQERQVDWSTFTTDLTQAEIDEAVDAIGPVILAFSTLEIQIAQTLSAALGISHIHVADALTANINAVDKLKLLKGVGGVMQTDGPVPQAKKLQRLGSLFAELSEDRNVVAHGTLAKCDGRVLIGSIQLSARLKRSGGTEKWIYFDELIGWHKRCREALDLTREIKPQFADGWAKHWAAEAD